MKVKICGVTHPEDAEFAAQAGADYIGLVFCPLSKRHVSLQTAKTIAQKAQQNGAEPVAVFTEHTLEDMHLICQETGIQTVQLHGTLAKEAALSLIKDYAVIYNISFPADEPSLPDSIIRLYDAPEPGSGTPFAWHTFTPPSSIWMLAGGLTPQNVAVAIALLKPYGVDVATGVEYPGSARKDPALVQAFIHAANIEIVAKG